MTQLNGPLIDMEPPFLTFSPAAIPALYALARVRTAASEMKVDQNHRGNRMLRLPFLVKFPGVRWCFTSRAARTTRVISAGIPQREMANSDDRSHRAIAAVKATSKIITLA